MVPRVFGGYYIVVGTQSVVYLTLGVARCPGACYGVKVSPHLAGPYRSVCMRKVNPLQLKNKAVCVVFSWMRAWGINARLPERPGEGDIVVGGVRVALAEGTVDADLTLSPAAILGSDLHATIAELHRLTKFLGLGAPAGFRNVTGKERAKSDDYLGCSMRLTPFGRTPNIPAADLKRWLPVLKRESDRAARRCAGLLTSMGLDKDDLYDIGLVYLSNYLGRHQTLGNEKINGANLTLSLIQQYGHWANTTIRHLKNVSPVASGLPLDLLVGSPCPGAHVAEQSTRVYPDDLDGTAENVMSYTMDFEKSPESKDDEPMDFPSEEARAKWEKQKATKHGRYLAKRRRNAKAALEDGLASMPHDRMVYVLSEVRDSNFHHPEAREEAHRRLTAHAGACNTCRKGHQ